MPVSRAGRKLEAALAQFGLSDAVRGARAVDVGASTGGFTEVLLAHSAAAVLAVDVGRAQLHETLRADGRVTSLEATDWRHLPLATAEGPFDFFTVDVSFAAARNMLRGLAFRLRPGAQGVVLVKPQFELPDRRVKAAGIDDPNLRREAVEKVRARGEALGFRLLAHVDSPVAGESGTVEILAHLRFDGRPTSLPQKGERRPAKPTRPARDRAVARGASGRPADLDWFAVVAPGLEEVAAREVAALSEAREVRTVDGGVEWRGPAASGMRANLWLRIATRVLARVGGFEARDFAKLRRRAARLPWRAFVPAGASVAVRASASKSRLYHTGGIAENVLLAVRDAIPDIRSADDAPGNAGEGAGDRASDRDHPDVALLARVVDDRFTISVDASGERLHRRGARIEAGPAPLRETLAAGLLALAGWTPGEPLVDPMCGTGAIVIEAATQAADRAPGLARAVAEGFAIARWPMVEGDAANRAALASLREEAGARERAASASAGEPPRILGSDRDPRAIDSARRNAARAGVEARIVFDCRDAADIRPSVLVSGSQGPRSTGLVATNPPYGRRLGDARAAARGYRDLARTLRAHFRGWRAAILVPASLSAERVLGLASPRRFALRNGGLPVTLVVGAIE